MKINANTKIAAILKMHSDALEVIISINPKFVKLRNPILRKLMAGRASIAMASKIAGCSVNTFYEKLKPLGFEIDESVAPEKLVVKELPDFMRTLKKEQLQELDVRPIISAGKDPLDVILKKINDLKGGEVLKIINTFEPIPLMLLLEKKGYSFYTDIINDDLVETYFNKKTTLKDDIKIPIQKTSEGWDKILEKFRDRLQIVDVRNLEMPLPMLTILEALEDLPIDKALFVYHKRVPVFLLPELTERKFEYRFKEIAEGEVHLLIYRV